MSNRRGAGVLLQRNFGPYFVGSLISYSGTWFQNIAQSLLVYRLTDSTFMVGVINFAQFAAILLLSPLSGVAADRFDRRKLIIATHLGASALTLPLAVLTWTGHITTLVAILFAFGVGATTALSLPAMQAMVPMLVSEEDVPAAVALNTVTFNFSRALGPVIGVIVITHWGIGTAFFLNSLSFLVMIAGVLFVKPRAQVIVVQAKLRDTLRVINSGPELKTMIILVALISLTVDPINTLTPGFATEIFDRMDTFTGFLIGAFGAGAVAGAFVLATVWRSSYLWMIGTLCFFAAMMIAFSLSSDPGFGIAFLFLAGIGFLLSQSSATIIVQTTVDDAHRGRVMALWTVAYLGIRPFASLVDGIAATLVSLRFAGLLMTVPTLIGAFLVFRLMSRRVRGEQEEIDGRVGEGRRVPVPPEQQVLGEIERSP
ncbi:MAG: MFS transporter [Actinobacteria bacterium]|nr:MFS transporter [Actinomycetota bacterium]